MVMEYFYCIEIIHLDPDCCCYLNIYTRVLIYGSQFYLLKASNVVQRKNTWLLVLIYWSSIIRAALFSIFSKSSNTFFGQLPSHYTTKFGIGYNVTIIK